MRTPLLGFLLSAVVIPAFAEDTDENTFWELNYQYTITSEKYLTAAMTDFKDNAFIHTKKLIFPETINHNGKTYSLNEIATKSLPDKLYESIPIIVPDHIKYIGESAFEMSTTTIKPTDIQFGTGVERIGAKACYGYAKKVHILNPNPPYLENSDAFKAVASGGKHSSVSRPDIFVPATAIENYRSSKYWEGLVDYIYAIGSFNFKLYGYFYFTDGMEINSQKTARLTFVNDTGSEIKAISAASSNPSLVEVSAEFVLPASKSLADIHLNSHDVPGDTDITVSVETEDGTIHTQKYYLKVRNSTVGIDEISDDSSRTTVYSINGVKVADSLDNLSPGIYIVNKNGKTQKIVVK